MEPPNQGTGPSKTARRLALAAIVSGLLGPFSLGVGPLVGIVLGGTAVVVNRRHGRDPRIEKLGVVDILTSVICLPISFLAVLSRG